MNCNLSLFELVISKWLDRSSKVIELTLQFVDLGSSQTPFLCYKLGTNRLSNFPCATENRKEKPPCGRKSDLRLLFTYSLTYYQLWFFFNKPNSRSICMTKASRVFFCLLRYKHNHCLLLLLSQELQNPMMLPNSNAKFE